jgi:D-cysteine desulfhydrase
MAERPIFERGRGHRLPHSPIAELPTPVEHRPALGAEIGVPELYVKLDGRTGDLYGGNKVRKLEFLLGDALDRDRDAVWTLGGIGSNHVLATAIYAREHGLVPHAAQFPQPVTDHVRENLLALSTTDPELTLVGSIPAVGLEILRTRARIAVARDPSLYYVPAGGSSALGTLGFVNAALELARQVAAGELPAPDVLVVPVGSGGSVSGLTVGCRLAGLDTTVLGVRVIEKLLTNRYTNRILRRQVESLLGDYGIEVPDSGASLELTGEYFGGRYGEPTTAGEGAKRLATEHGLQLDSTYTAKAFAAIRGERDRRWLDEQTVLLWHTLSAVDLTERLEAGSPDRLPSGYRQFLTESAE